MAIEINSAIMITVSTHVTANAELLISENSIE